MYVRKNQVKLTIIIMTAFYIRFCKQRITCKHNIIIVNNYPFMIDILVSLQNYVT